MGGSSRTARGMENTDASFACSQRYLTYLVCGEKKNGEGTLCSLSVCVSVRGMRGRRRYEGLGRRSAECGAIQHWFARRIRSQKSSAFQSSTLAKGRSCLHRAAITIIHTQVLATLGVVESGDIRSIAAG